MQRSGMAGHSLGEDLYETYGPLDNVRDTLAALYLGT
jgi:hypothetical protein